MTPINDEVEMFLNLLVSVGRSSDTASALAAYRRMKEELGAQHVHGGRAFEDAEAGLKRLSK